MIFMVRSLIRFQFCFGTATNKPKLFFATIPSRSNCPDKYSMPSQVGSIGLVPNEWQTVNIIYATLLFQQVDWFPLDRKYR